jgi:hypothetical protein
MSKRPGPLALFSQLLVRFSRSYGVYFRLFVDLDVVRENTGRLCDVLLSPGRCCKLRLVCSEVRRVLRDFGHFLVILSQVR